MAYEIPGQSLPYPAGADFSAGKQFRFVNLNTSAKVVDPAAGGPAIGVRQNRPKANEATTVVIGGVSIVEAGGELAAGDLVATDNVGRAVEAAAGNVVLGRAQESASAAGIQVAVLLHTPTANAPSGG